MSKHYHNRLDHIRKTNLEESILASKQLFKVNKEDTTSMDIFSNVFIVDYEQVFTRCDKRFLSLYFMSKGHLDIIK